MSNLIHIVGLGPGDLDSISLGALKLLKENRVLFRTKIHPTVKEIENIGIKYDSLDDIYEKESNFHDVYDKISDEVINRFLDEDSDLVFAVPGNPMIAENSVLILIEKLKSKNIEYKIHAAVSFIDAVMASLGKDPINGLLVIDALDIEKKHITNEADTLITQVYNKRVASLVKIELSKYLDDESDIYFLRACGVKEEESIRKIKLYELDRQEDIDHLTSIYIEKEIVLDSFYDLVRTTSALRAPNGCPWDKEQTHESLKRYLIEESYEVLDAIDDLDYEHLTEELGDVLFQVMIHSQIGSEEEMFDINDVVRGINHKMVSRHPHVFKDTKVKDSNEVLVNWELNKSKEKGNITLEDKLKMISKASPASIRTVEFLKKAKSFGIEKPKYVEIVNKMSAVIDSLKPDDLRAAVELLYLTYILIDNMGHDPETLANKRLDEEISLYLERK